MYFKEEIKTEENQSHVKLLEHTSVNIHMTDIFSLYKMLYTYVTFIMFIKQNLLSASFTICHTGVDCSLPLLG